MKKYATEFDRQLAIQRLVELVEGFCDKESDGLSELDLKTLNIIMNVLVEIKTNSLSNDCQPIIVGKFPRLKIL